MAMAASSLFKTIERGYHSVALRGAGYFVARGAAGEAPLDVNEELVHGSTYESGPKAEAKMINGETAYIVKVAKDTPLFCVNPKDVEEAVAYAIRSKSMNQSEAEKNEKQAQTAAKFTFRKRRDQSSQELEARKIVRLTGGKGHTGFKPDTELELTKVEEIDRTTGKVVRQLPIPVIPEKPKPNQSTSNSGGFMGGLLSAFGFA